PDPISFAPDQNWDGIDGEWSSFPLRIGTPPKIVRVFVSTSSQQTWAVQTNGCPYGTQEEKVECQYQRGWVFNWNDSSTWDDIGTYNTWINRQLGYNTNAVYGYDTVGLGMDEGEGPLLEDQVVGAIAGNPYWLGIFGVHPKPTNFSGLGNITSPSFMSTLREQNLIPSLSFGFTAGARYQFTGVLASLTLGGYDSSKFIPNDVSFVFNPDNERELTVGLRSITTTKDSDVQLLPDPIYAFVDSTVPHIWLPIEACRIFEDTFGLIYDNVTDLYLVEDDLHDTLLEENANITFTLGRDLKTGATVDIVFPYAAFDLTAKAGYFGLREDTKYFPLRRAHNNTQYTLGRTFLQEAYVTVDWERANFNVSQVKWVLGEPQNIVAIPAAHGYHNSTSPPSEGGSSSPGSGTIAGIALGAVALVVVLILAFLYHRRRSRAAALNLKLQRSISPVSTPATDLDKKTPDTTVFPKAELDATQTATKRNSKDAPLSPLTPGAESTLLNTPTTPFSPGSPGFPAPGSPLSPVEVEATEREIFEMPGDVPAASEADGRMFSEKEAMVYRERIFNGVDPAESQSPTSTSPTRVDADNEAL
ncbi:acid protease, partial [Patellaria atrata CBS 101060]